jgi:hypothetical protein
VTTPRIGETRKESNLRQNRERAARRLKYAASPVSEPTRSHATKEAMEERAEFLIAYAEEHGPMTVRGLYYQAEVAGLPGIAKDEAGYAAVQRQVLALRRDGRLSYSAIADGTRLMIKPKSYKSIEAALQNVAQFYRKALWTDTEEVVEVWCEKDALAGVISPVTAKYDVPLMVCRGYASETFAYNSVAAYDDEERPVHIYYLGDFDRSGQDAARTLEEKLRRFGEEFDVEVVFKTIAVTEQQIADWRLPTRPPKRKSRPDQLWSYDRACELDAIPPDMMRQLVSDAIEQHLPAHQLRVLKVAEASERTFLRELAA